MSVHPKLRSSNPGERVFLPVQFNHGQECPCTRKFSERLAALRKRFNIFWNYIGSSSKAIQYFRELHWKLFQTDSIFSGTTLVALPKRFNIFLKHFGSPSKSIQFFRELLWKLFQTDSVFSGTTLEALPDLFSIFRYYVGSSSRPIQFFMGT